MNSEAWRSSWDLKDHEREELEQIAPFVVDEAELEEYLRMYRGTLKAHWLDLGLDYSDLGKLLTSTLREVIARTAR